jgi:hypothetical protein
MNLIKRFAGGASVFVTIIVVVVVVALLLAFSSQFFYIFERVDEQEVGIQFQSGQIINIVEPGVYSDFGLFVEMVKVSSQAIPFTVTDEEIITKDKQRIGLVVSGDIFRPNAKQADQIERYWAQYRQIYLDDELARNRVQDLARQSMKVCVGDSTFDDSIIGTARDDLRSCIDTELSELARNFGLEIDNVVVPEVILSPAVQVALDAIVQSRLETEKAAQDKLRALAQSSAEQARQEGEIRVEQSRLQEQAKQEIVLAQLQQEKTTAQKVVIEAERANELARVEAEKAIIVAQKENDLLAAQQDLEINRALAVAAEEKANADLAQQKTLAEIYAANPDYLNLQIIQANASALRPTDKIIFTPEGTIPNLVFPGPGIVPTVNTNPTVQAPVQPPQPAEEAEADNEETTTVP